MKSPTSFYNLAIMRSNIKRYGFLSVIFFILSCTISNIGVIANLVSPYNALNFYEDSLSMLYVNAWDIFMVFAVSVIAGVILFRYIQDERALSAIHAMPISRRSMFGSQFITYELLFGLPVILNGVIAFIIIVAKGYPIGFVAGQVIIGIMGQFIAGTTIFALTVLMGMLVGSSVLQVALTAIMMGAPFAIVELSRVLIDWTLKGYPHELSEEAIHVLCTLYYTVPMALTGGFNDRDMYLKGLVVLVLILIACVLLSYYLYHKRDLEKHHDLIAFQWAKKLFIGLLSVLITLSLASLIGSLMGESTQGAYIGLVFGAALGYCITKMIAEKTVSILKFYKEGLAVVVAFVVVLLIVDLDLIGYESRVPDIEEVEAVYYSNGWGTNLYVEKSSEAGSSMLSENGGTAVFEQAIAIDAVASLHKSLIDEVHSSYVINDRMVLIYQLKNGRRIHREYNTDVDPEYLKAIYEQAEYKEKSMAYLQELFMTTDNIQVTINTPSGTSRVISKDAYAGLLAAYSNDFKGMTFYEEYTSDQWGYLQVEVLDERSSRGNEGQYRRVDYLSFRIRPGFTHTFAWMEANEMGYLNFDPKDVTSITIASRYHEIQSYYNETDDDPIYDEGYYYDDVYIEKATMTGAGAIQDPALIEDLLALGHDYTRMYEEGYNIECQLADGGYYSYRLVDLPDDYKDYVNQW